MTFVLMKRGNVGKETHTQRTLYEYEDEGRDILQAKECPRLPENHQKLGEKPGPDSFFQPPERTNPVGSFIPDFQPPELGDNTFLFFKPPSLWYFVTAALGN